MSWLSIALLLTSCWTYVQTQDEGVGAVLVRESGGALHPVVSRRTIPYHPLVRFRAMEVPPAFFYTVENPPDPEDMVGLTSGDLVQLLSTVYKEEYDEPPPTHLSKSTIRFGIIR